MLGDQVTQPFTASEDSTVIRSEGCEPGRITGKGDFPVLASGAVVLPEPIETQEPEVVVPFGTEAERLTTSELAIEQLLL